MRHLLHTFDGLPIGATFWFEGKRTTVRGATYERKRGPYVKVDTKRYKDESEDYPDYYPSRADARVRVTPPDGNRAKAAKRPCTCPAYEFPHARGEGVCAGANRTTGNHVGGTHPERCEWCLKPKNPGVTGEEDFGAWFCDKRCLHLAREAAETRGKQDISTRRLNRTGGKRVSTKPVDFGNGIRVVYLPVNQAWVVMWMDQIVRGPIPRHEAMTEAAQITGTSPSQSAPPRQIGRLANRAGETAISREQRDDIERREHAYEMARDRFDPKRFKRGGGYTPEEVAQIEQMAGGPAPTNEERGAAEQYEWIVDVPEQAFLYYDKDRVSGWMGDVRGHIVWRGKIQHKFGGGKSQAIRVQGTNGATYHGIANLTGGNYVRLRIAKAEGRALKKLEGFIS